MTELDLAGEQERSYTSAAGSDELFDEPAQRRAEVIDRFVPPTLHAVAAGAAPGFPQLMPMLVRAADGSPPGPCLDIGAGLGGLGVMWAEASRRTVIALEPGEGSTAGARRLFASLDIVQAAGGRLPVRSGSVAAAIMIGVTSLVENVDDLLSEAERVLRPHGRLCVVDLVANGRDELVAAPNWFRPLEAIERAGRPGFDVVERAVADPAVGTWTGLGEHVANRLEDEFADESAFEAWRSDQRHLHARVESGDVLVGATVLTRAR